MITGDLGKLFVKKMEKMRKPNQEWEDLWKFANFFRRRNAMLPLTRAHQQQRDRELASPVGAPSEEVGTGSSGGVGVLAISTTVRNWSEERVNSTGAVRR